ncbi:cysteine-rich CWC family protein [Marinobacter sp.]|uniref:cysteine-rich CWC family protein n=1 Tax=Marinobacter sp. TaxID=50741 RepID=UPI0039A6DE29
MTMHSPSHHAPCNAEAAHCPLCGQENRCAVTAGREPASCWCFAPDIEFTEAVKAAIPPAKRLTACLCADCVVRLTRPAPTEPTP